MKNKNLIKRLSEYDPEMDVFIYKEGDILTNAFMVSEIKFTKGGDCKDAGAGIIIELVENKPENSDIIVDKELSAEITAIASAAGQTFNDVIKEMLDNYKDKYPRIFK